MAPINAYVRPSVPLVPETMSLSPFDQFIGRHYSPVLLIFKTAPNASFEIIVSQLQQGLANLLDEMPFLASNVVMMDEERDHLQLEVPDDAAVLFRIRDLTESGECPELDFDELEKNHFPTSVLESTYLSPLSIEPDSVAPTLAVQATCIRGGVVLAIYLHHTVVDGDGAAILLNRWAKHVKAISEGRTLPSSDYFDNNALDRSPLFPMHHSENQLFDFPGFQDAAGSEGAWLTCGKSMAMYEKAQTSRTLVGHWFFPKESLRALEALAKPKNPNDIKMTEATVLTAFVWKHFTRARRLEEKGIKKVSCHNPCNIRGRIEPQLHPDFPGNAVVPSKAELPISELLSSESDALYRTASVLRNSIEWWTSDRVWGLLGAMESWPRCRDIERIMDLNFKTDLHMTNVSGLSLMKHHWGEELGPVRSFNMPGMSMMDGFGIIMPRSPCGGLLMLLFTDPEAHENMKADEEFTRFAEFKCI